MKKTLTVGTILVLVSMILGTLFSAQTGFNLIMSDAPVHGVARAVLVVALLAILLTARPRHQHVRVALGVVAAGVAGFALSQTAKYSLMLMDSLMYMLAATIMMIEAIEPEPRLKLSSSLLNEQAAEA